MDQVVRAATPEQIALAEERQRKKAEREAKGTPKFVSDEGRQVVIPLAFPIEYDGATYSEITISRPTIREWRVYMRAVAAESDPDDPDSDDTVDMPFVSAPAAVLNALDFVDGASVEATIDGFFARLSPQDPGSGDDGTTSTSDNGEQSPSP